ncbi:HlyD family secretion protein [Pedobacter psychroterrae]|uniref:HlyD family efflux transporter periplasmic adaptor subunit n=1 Tax=Pedobacter psychroterrae TaxID=2530453 RepID=A0A4R0NNN2_9SPHI|nr:HlyD family efflux transporter periplasmic adaptor subunit [Pedobacter psychroterrae]TCD01263.1 HlyD family efflux transporter periplasmic adaptor subunit [Pedobacter psychroterrae]
MKKELKNSERTEEVHEIISRMPTGIGIKITIFISIILIIFFTLAWIIKYPDSVTGEMVINSTMSPVKLIANSSGKIRLAKYKNQDFIREGQYIAIMQNPAHIEDIQRLITLTSQFLKKKNDKRIQQVFPYDLSLGELNVPYYKFLNILNQYYTHRKASLFDKQLEILNTLSTEYEKILSISEKRAAMNAKSLKYVNKFQSKDSILFKKKVLSESEYDRSEMTSLSAQDIYQTLLKDISNTRSQLRQTQNDIQQMTIQKTERDRQLELELITSFVDLQDNINMWEQRYVFKAPFDGTIQFLKFWNDNQYIQTGEPVFTIIPVNSSIIGQMTLPSAGAGKVKVGQSVIVKLRDYPYFEYGSINGRVASIAQTSNNLRTQNGEVETYLVNVDLPNKLTTNFGTQLDFKFEIKGTGDIITNDRRLLERFFDNLKYKLTAK